MNKRPLHPGPQVLLARAMAGVAQPGAAGLPPALLQGALSPLGTLQGVTVEGSVNGTVANGAMATVGQQLQLQPPPPQQQQRAPLQAVLRGGAAALAAGVAPDGEEADEATDGTVLATSCAHGPLVTHPHMSSAQRDDTSETFPREDTSETLPVLPVRRSADGVAHSDRTATPGTPPPTHPTPTPTMLARATSAAPRCPAERDP